MVMDNIPSTVLVVRIVLVSNTQNKKRYILLKKNEFIGAACKKTNSNTAFTFTYYTLRTGDCKYVDTFPL